jgi:hypothetical protein
MAQSTDEKTVIDAHGGYEPLRVMRMNLRRMTDICTHYGAGATDGCRTGHDVIGPIPVPDKNAV